MVALSARENEVRVRVREQGLECERERWFVCERKSFSAVSEKHFYEWELTF